MATPKRIPKEQVEANMKKQQVLRQAGYNIKADGSWGPWQEEQYRRVLLRRPQQEEPYVRPMLRSPQQEEQYRRVISKGPWQGAQQRTVTSNGEQYRKILPKEKAEKLFSKQANVGVLALPVGEYGAASLLRGLGSVALPSLSIPSAAVGPFAILGGIAGAAYDQYTGDHRPAPSTPEQMKYGVYAPDATRVSGPIALDFPGQVKSGPIGERYVNPILSREATRSRHLAAEAANDSAAADTTNRVIINVDPISYDYPEDPQNQQDPEDNENKKNDNENKKNDKKGNSNNWFKLWERSSTPSTPKNPDFWRHVRNLGVRVPLYTGVAAPVIDVVGNIAGAANEPDNVKHKWTWNASKLRFSIDRALWKLFRDSYTTPVDSTGMDTTQAPLSRQQAASSVQQVGDTASRRLATTPTQEQIDSVNRAFYGE